jgi:exodeoxyribonuclease V alpha subunit
MEGGGMTLQLDPTQQRAVEMALEHRVSIITGGPGTGKTTIVKAILSELGDVEVALCAPTGKAARRLEEQVNKDRGPGQERWLVSTIHRLLAFNPAEGGFTFCAGFPLPQQVVIIDESSMVDVELAAALLDAVSDGARVVFVGDADQLPSVGPGSLLRDLVASEQIPVTRLTTIHRQQSESAIPYAARAVLAGELPEPGVDVLWTEREDPAEVAALVVDTAAQLPLARKLARSDVQVLCPQRTTPIGVNALNERLQELLNPAAAGRPEWKVGGGTLREGDRVMHVKNNYRLGVMNGEIGEITAAGDELVVDFGDRTVDYSRGAASELTLCYATTIHKSQGSEYPAVIVPVHTSNSYMLSRALLYTAITRGKQLVWLVGNRKGLKRAVRNAETAKRYSALASRLQGVVA